MFVGSVALVTLAVRFFPTAGTIKGVHEHAAYAAASLAVTAIGAVYGLVPAGRPRRVALGVAIGICAALAAFCLFCVSGAMALC